MGVFVQSRDSSVSTEESDAKASSSGFIYPATQIVSNPNVKSFEEYKEMYEESVKDPQQFWSRMASSLLSFNESADGIQRPILEYNFDPRKGPVFTRFMEGRTINVCYNMLDRHVLAGRGNKVALYWEGNDPNDSCHITFAQLLEKVKQFANGLKSLGVGKGDVVAIYMPMVVEIVVAMLACVRIGAVHSVVFVGYSAEALADRLVDGKAKVLVTADGSWRGDKFLALKETCDEAILKAEAQGYIVKNCVILQHLKRLHKHQSYNAIFNVARDQNWDTLCSQQSGKPCPPVYVEAEHPILILYTSGSTGKPKGVVHSTFGYFLFAATVFKYSFDFRPCSDIFFSTSDMGWMCAHTNILYGPLGLGGSALLFEGSPFHPTPSRLWEIINKYRVTILYTAPTLLRHLMKSDETTPVLPSLRVLGTVGEPISSEEWEWYHSVVGRGKCPVVDTYGQTETGGHLITSLPGATPTKPGAAGLPFFGCRPSLLNPDDGTEFQGPGIGTLAFKTPWPSILRTINGDPKRYEESYFTKFPGYYLTGDAARRDEDGYYSIVGRVDDMLNVSGHLISTTAIEAALSTHVNVADCAVVGAPDQIKGHNLMAWVVLKSSITITSMPRDVLVANLKQQVREKVGSFSVPDAIIITPVLPMTRSGKILRRVLATLAQGRTDFGDISCLLDESVLLTLIQIVQNNRGHP